MGTLEGRKSRAVFETTNSVRERGKDRPVVVELKPEYMMLRLKGTRRMEILSYTSALNLAIRNRLFRQKMEKAKERAEKRGKR